MKLSHSSTDDFSLAVFGPYSVDIRRRTLHYGEEVIKIEPLIYDLLVYFIKNRERVISRDELCQEIWQQEYVDNNAINRAISELRRCISKFSEEGDVIRTHYRKGYSFVLPVLLDPSPSMLEQCRSWVKQVLFQRRVVPLNRRNHEL